MTARLKQACWDYISHIILVSDLVMIIKKKKVILHSPLDLKFATVDLHTSIAHLSNQ